MMLMNTKFRSTKEELMDDFKLEGAVLRDTLKKLEHINKWLGGNGITLQGVAKLLKNQPKSTVYHIVDVGCGHGDLLRLVAKWGVKNCYQLRLTGLDANQDAVNYANELSTDYENIDFICEDVFSKSFQNTTCHITLATLFMHHFKDEDLLKLLSIFNKNSKLGIVVNDLQRSNLAYALFKVIGLFIANNMVKQDGLTSIARAFKKAELIHYSETLNLNYQIHWRWAFRYQWIITT